MIKNCLLNILIVTTLSFSSFGSDDEYYYGEVMVKPGYTVYAPKGKEFRPTSSLEKSSAYEDAIRQWKTESSREMNIIHDEETSPNYPFRAIIRQSDANQIIEIGFYDEDADRISHYLTIKEQESINRGIQNYQDYINAKGYGASPCGVADARKCEKFNSNKPDPWKIEKDRLKKIIGDRLFLLSNFKR